MEYAKAGSVEYIINEKLSFENGQVISDAIATLRAQNAELRDALTDLYNVCQNDGLWESIPNHVQEAARAILAKHGDDNA